ncbi:MAG: hypothetical protein WA105_06450 [Candidatus Hydromicrobium sp.]
MVKDNTITYKGKYYQIYENPASRKVAVEERNDGQIYIIYEGKELIYDIIVKVDRKKVEIKKEIKAKPTIKLKPDHPWRSRRKDRGIVAVKL